MLGFGEYTPCGFDDKPCATCRHAGGCLASMREDLYAPAEFEDVIERLDAHEYEQDRGLMKEFLLRKYLYDYDRKTFIRFEYGV